MRSHEIYFRTQNLITIRNKILYFLCLPTSSISIQNKILFRIYGAVSLFFAQNIDNSQVLLYY